MYKWRQKQPHYIISLYILSMCVLGEWKKLIKNSCFFVSFVRFVCSSFVDEDKYRFFPLSRLLIAEEEREEEKKKHNLHFL